LIEPLLLTAARILTFEQQRTLTNASGFFFERDKRLFLVTSRHVVIDEPSKHFPDRLEIELHIDPDNLARSTGFSIPLYRDGESIWRQGLESTGRPRAAWGNTQNSSSAIREVLSKLHSYYPPHFLKSVPHSVSATS
jgi:hypothetical protein